MKVTAADQLFHDSLTPELTDLDRVVTEVSEVNSRIRSKISARFVSSAGYTVIPDAVAHFRGRRPLVELSLRQETTDEQVELLGMQLEQIHTESLA